MRQPATHKPLGRWGRWTGLLAAAATATLGAGCGGGGGGNVSPAVTQLGAAEVVVRDAFGAPVVGATVQQATANSAAVNTDAGGVAYLVAPPGPISLTITVPTFTPVVTWANLDLAGITTVAVTLERATAPAGGSLATRSGVAPARSADGRTVGFEVELLVLGADGQPVDGLTAADFQLLACQPDATSPAADCLRNAQADHAYLASGAASSLHVVAAQPVVAHTVGLLIDQSGSIASSDRLNGRLYAAKALVSELAAGDQTLIGAFADGVGALLPEQPLTVLYSVPDAAAAPQSFAALDALAGQSGGQTPLYASIDAMRARLVADASLRPDLHRALVVFTDGADSYCTSLAGCAQQRQKVIAAARADGVRLFTIGLSGSIDVEALSQLATDSGGAMLYADRVEQLIPLYGSLGKLVSLGLPTYRLRFAIDAGEAGVFASGQKVLARAQVQVRGQAVDIPFAVSIP